MFVETTNQSCGEQTTMSCKVVSFCSWGRLVGLKALEACEKELAPKLY